jgi:hypothetical protein
MSLIFGYEAGAAMIGFRAPARRVGFFTGEGTLPAINETGLTLFDAALFWAGNTNTALVTDFLRSLSADLADVTLGKNLGLENVDIAFSGNQITESYTLAGVGDVERNWTVNPDTMTLDISLNGQPLFSAGRLIANPSSSQTCHGRVFTRFNRDLALSLSGDKVREAIVTFVQASPPFNSTSDQIAFLMGPGPPIIQPTLLPGKPETPAECEINVNACNTACDYDLATVKKLSEALVEELECQASVAKRLEGNPFEPISLDYCSIFVRRVIAGTLLGGRLDRCLKNCDDEFEACRRQATNLSDAICAVTSVPICTVTP